MSHRQKLQIKIDTAKELIEHQKHDMAKTCRPDDTRDIPFRSAISGKALHKTTVKHFQDRNKLYLDRLQDALAVWEAVAALQDNSLSGKDLEAKKAECQCRLAETELADFAFDKFAFAARQRVFYARGKDMHSEEALKVWKEAIEGVDYMAEKLLCIAEWVE